MKNRKCNICKQKIYPGIFIKCCESKMKGQIQKLIHVGDICVQCWNEHIQK